MVAEVRGSPGLKIETRGILSLVQRDSPDHQDLGVPPSV
jgi:hypothetical protein